MKKMNLVLSLLALILSANFANAGLNGHGVERILPRDAHNARLFEASLEPFAVGQKLIADGNDGQVYENVYKTVLSVTVFYDSKDLSDNYYNLGSGNNGEHTGWDPAPQNAVIYNFMISAEQVAAIKAGTLDPKKAVQVSISNKEMSMEVDAGVQALCRYDNDSNMPLDGCVEPAAPRHAEIRPVLDVTFNP